MSRQVSIKKAWTALIVVVGILPAIILLSLSGLQNFDRRLNESMWRENAFNRELKESIQGEIKRYITLLQNKSDPLAYALSNKEDNALIAELIEKILHREPTIHGLLLVSKNDQVISSHDRALDKVYTLNKPATMNDSQWLKLHWGLEVEQTYRSPDLVIPLHGRTYIGPSHPHEDEETFNIAVPVGGFGQPEAILIAEIDIASLWQGRQQTEHSGIVTSYLVDRRGSLITKLLSSSEYLPGDLVSHLPIVRSALGTGEWDQRQVYPGLSGQPVYGTVTQVPLVNWAVISEIPSDQINTPILLDLFRSSILITFLIILVTGLGLWLVRRMLIPIENLTAAMGDFARGEEFEPISASRIKEYDEMGAAFERMVFQREQTAVELKKAYSELEYKVAKRTRDLHKANRLLVQARDKANISSQAKSNFLATMSHEIRTPMNGVLGMTELLEDSKLDETQLGYIRVIKRSGATLMTVINDILDYSKIEAGKLKLESLPFNFADLVEEIVIPYKLSQDNNVKMIVTLDSDVPQHLSGDAIRLHQVVSNLLNNAFKFTHHGTVNLKISVDKFVDDRAVINFRVIDTGIGIGEDIQSTLFESFTQADQSTARKYGGTGLGLSICKYLVELMGGEITVESELDKGSTFSFSIPLDVESVFPIDDTQSEVEASYTKLRVLLAEDNPVNQLVAQGLLKKLGIQASVVSNGVEAVDIVCGQKLPFDLILMDCEMPELDGYTATRKIREWEHANNQPVTPIYALTAHVLTDHIIKSCDAGMDGHLSKPIGLDQLREIFKKHCPSLSAVSTGSTISLSADQLYADLSEE